MHDVLGLHQIRIITGTVSYGNQDTSGNFGNSNGGHWIPIRGQWTELGTFFIQAPAPPPTVPFVFCKSPPSVRPFASVRYPSVTRIHATGVGLPGVVPRSSLRSPPLDSNWVATASLEAPPPSGRRHRNRLRRPGVARPRVPAVPRPVRSSVPGHVRPREP